MGRQTWILAASALSSKAALDASAGVGEPHLLPSGEARGRRGRLRAQQPGTAFRFCRRRLRTPSIFTPRALPDKN